MDATPNALIRDELSRRRARLEEAVQTVGRSGDLLQLIEEVDAAIARIEDGTFGHCEVCHDPIEPDRLMADPLLRFCLDHLSPQQRTDLQEDLDLAARIQSGLLPPKQMRTEAWSAAFRYGPLGAVSGDYCDLLDGGDGSYFFALGDVSGKGVAASMLMAHLHASIRVLMGSGLGVEEMVKRTSRVFCESTLPSHYVTLVCGHCHPDGRVELVNAGHVPPMLVRRDGVFPLDATGLPIGLFCQEEFQVRRLEMAPGDALVAYTDGLTEVSDGREEFGRTRLAQVLSGARGDSAEDLVLSCLRAADAFRGRHPFTDDISILAIRRE